MATFNESVAIISASSTALTVQPYAANYGLQVDESGSGGSAATGLKITAAAAGSGLALSTISTGTNEDLSIDAKGSGKVTVGGTSTGSVILATGGGNVGIGTASPTAALSFGAASTINTLAGDLNLTPAVHLVTTKEFYANGNIRHNAANDLGVIVMSNQSLVFYTNNTFRMKIEDTDKVGIGTTSPASRLDIADGAFTMQEMTAPSSPAADKCIIYAEDNGAGKTRLMVKFATGAAQQIAIEP